MPSKLVIPKGEIEEGMPIRTISTQMMSWMAQLDVLDVGSYALPGGMERRTFDVDSRLKINPMYVGGQNVGPSPPTR